MDYSPPATDVPARTMPPFVRVLVGVIIVGVCLTLGVMIVRHYQVKQRQLEHAQHERAAVVALFERLNRRMRRADIAVGSQVVSGERRIIQTTLICRRYALDASSISSIPLTPQIISVSGDAAIIRGLALSFAPTFKFEEDYADYSGVVAGKTIYLFESIRANDPQDAGSPIANRSQVPSTCQTNPLGEPSMYEKELWHKIWNLAHDIGTNDLAGGRGLEIQHFKSPAIVLKPGVIYRIWIEGSSQPMIHEEDDPAEIADLLRAMPQAQPGK